MLFSRSPRRSISAALFAAALAGGLAAAGSAEASQPFTLFESGQVRPLSMSPDGKLLFAVNTPDNRLEIFKIKNGGLIHRGSVPVGLEPVAVAARSNDEVWVVNHLSDSVSVVKLDGDGKEGRVVRTLLVGDEPRDIVFAGPGHKRAFITTAHRGQNVPYDPQLTTPGIGRADVWVFDANHLGDSLTGDPLTIVTLFTDTPRALAVSPDGDHVYAAGFHTGNRTSIVTETAVPDGFGPDGVAGPITNFQGVPAPEVSVIVKFDGTHWVDTDGGRIWDDKVKFSLPDKDVFVIDAKSNPPKQVAGAGGFFTGVGTILFNMAVNPVSGKIYVSNTDAHNDTRFEGPGTFAGHSVRGHLHESRITVLTPGGGVTPRHLNKHIDYSSCCAPTPNAESEKSLAQPQGMAVTSDGATLYVAALGSSKVGVFKTSKLENDTFVPSTANQIPVTGGGPTGIVLDEDRHRLYVMTRFDNAISIVSTLNNTEVGHVSMHNPEPASVVNGRRFLYDASTSSAHGDSSCASCHIFGDFDSLAWDLGNPDAEEIPNPGPFPVGIFNEITQQPIENPTFNPMKGPMATQSLRGMQNHGPMHWRGDRTGGNDAPNAQPDSGSYDEKAGFRKFQGGFTELLGRSGPIPDADIDAFADFILQVTYPPNPHRALDNSLTTLQQKGKDFFFGPVSDAIAPCGGCHVLDRNVNPGSAAPGLFGSSSGITFDFVAMLFKVPHLRNLYQKVGMFGMPNVPVAIHPGNNDDQGDQVRGFGFINDGSFDTLFRFVNASGFQVFPGNADGLGFTPEDDEIRHGIESFLLAFDSNMAPIVGQQVTLTKKNADAAGPRIDLMIARAEAGECDLVAKSQGDHGEDGFLYVGSGKFLRDRQGAPQVSDAKLRKIAKDDSEVTYTCTPPGSGVRIGLDRDGDGFLDGDERDAGSDPADASSTP